VRLHRLVVPQVVAAFAEIGRAGFASDILFWGGSYNPRLMRGTTRLSRHAFGIAFDLNPQQNPFHRRPAVEGEDGSLQRIARVMEVYGMCWGGWWDRPDGMHFEVARLGMP
jgi:hypothetical protein